MGICISEQVLIVELDLSTRTSRYVEVEIVAIYVANQMPCTSPAVLGRKSRFLWLKVARYLVYWIWLLPTLAEPRVSYRPYYPVSGIFGCLMHDRPNGDDNNGLLFLRPINASCQHQRHLSCWARSLVQSYIRWEDVIFYSCLQQSEPLLPNIPELPKLLARRRGG